MKRLLALTFFAFFLFVAGHASAMELSKARAQGLVGERLDGYVATVTPSPEVNALVSEINQRRRAEYEKISKANGQPVAIVGKVAAENIINGLPSGTLYQSPAGGWTKK